MKKPGLYAVAEPVEVKDEPLKIYVVNALNAQNAIAAAREEYGLPNSQKLRAIYLTDAYGSLSEAKIPVFCRESTLSQATNDN